jgi:hypothetical protein
MNVLNEHHGRNFSVYNADCVEFAASLPDNSIDFTVYSPPFSNLFVYSDSERDMGNAADDDEFFEHYDFIVREIHRVTMPGRMTAVHCMPVPTGNTGRDGFMDFPGDLIRQHTMCRKEDCAASPRMKANGICGHGWFEYVAMYNIWKEPLGVRNRLMIKSLAHKTIVDDSSKCSVAAADQLLVFRKVGKNPVPVTHPTGLSEYAGEREIPKDLLRYKDWKGSQLENRYSHWIWRQYASAFWDDIRIQRVLPHRSASGGKLEEDDEKHVHPLQLDVIDRCLHLWSNPGENVLTPFMGVGSEVYSAIRQGRRGIGIELKTSYYNQARLNVSSALTSQEVIQPAFEFSDNENE